MWLNSDMDMNAGMMEKRKGKKRKKKRKKGKKVGVGDARKNLFPCKERNVRKEDPCFLGISCFKFSGCLAKDKEPNLWFLDHVCLYI